MRVLKELRQGLLAEDLVGGSPLEPRRQRLIVRQHFDPSLAFFAFFRILLYFADKYVSELLHQSSLDEVIEGFHERLEYLVLLLLLLEVRDDFLGQIALLLTRKDACSPQRVHSLPVQLLVVARLNLRQVRLQAQGLVVQKRIYRVCDA